MRGEKGFALILTLIVTALMVAALVEMIHQTYVDVSLSRGYRDGQQASLLAESGIKGGIKLLQLSLLGKDYTSLNDAWAKPVKLDDDTGAIEVTVVEESGRINLNTLVQDNGADIEPDTQAKLVRLGNQLKIPEDVWNSLADWIDVDDQSRSKGGAETPYYKSKKIPYTARNGRLATISELSLIEGFTPEFIAKLKPFVTLYSEKRDTNSVAFSRININTASEEVLMALDNDIDEHLAKRILEVRRLKPFQGTGDLANVSGAESLPVKLKNITVKGNLFRITSKATVKETTRTVEAVMRLNGEILSWQE